MSALLKKVNYFILVDFFREILRLKKIISLNSFNHTIPSAVRNNNKTIINLFDVAIDFNNYLPTATIDIQPSIRLSKKKYFDYLQPLNINYSIQLQLIALESQIFLLP